MNQNLDSIQDNQKPVEVVKTKTYKDFLHNKIVIKTFWSFLLLILVISLIRVPYIGVFIDSTIFSFLFGFGKYLLYVYLMVWLIFKLFDISKFKVILSKRFFLSTIISTILLSVMFSGIELVNVLAQNNTNNLVNSSFIDQYLDYWYLYIFKMDGFVFGMSNYIDGGLIGSLVATINGVFIIIFAIVCIILVYAIMFKSWRNLLIQNYYKLKNKQKKTIKDTNTNTIQEQLDFIECEKNMKTNKLQFIHNSDINYINSLLQFNKPQHLSFNTISIDIDTNKILNIILTFINQNNIKIVDHNIVKKQEYLDIILNLSSEEYAKFKNVISSIKLQLNEYDFINIYSEDNLTFRFILNKNMIDNSVQIILKAKITNPLNYVFALNQSSLPIILDLQKNTTIGVYDEYKKNYYNLIATVVSSISWNYSYKNIEIVYLSLTNNDNNNKIFATPNSRHKPLHEIKDIIEYLNNLEVQCKILMNKFKDNNIKNIYEWNDKSSSIVPNKVIFVNDIDLLMSSEPSIILTLNNLFKLARYCGLTFFMFDHSKDFKSYNKLNYELLCLFKTSSENSKYILNNSNAHKLVRFNDGILYDSYRKKELGLFVPIYNEASIKEIVMILKKCFEQHQI